MRPGAAVWIAWLLLLGSAAAQASGSPSAAQPAGSPSSSRAAPDPAAAQAKGESPAAPGARATGNSVPLPEDVRAAARLSVAPLTVEAAQAAVAKFQAAVSAGDARRVAALTRFPLRVNGPEGSRTIADARAFRREFAALFDAGLRSRVAAQSFATMPMGYRGLMLDDGRLWLQPACLKPGRDGGCRDADYALRLVAINVPAPEAPAR